jgi:hypothetical protein
MVRSYGSALYLQWSTVLVITENLVTGNVVTLSPLFYVGFPVKTSLKLSLVMALQLMMNYLQFVSLSRAITIEED